jgi:guanylate kinase
MSRFLFVLVGKSGCDRDKLIDRVVEEGLAERLLSCTNREKRDYEVDGVHYRFFKEYQYDDDNLMFSHAFPNYLGEAIQYWLWRCDIPAGDTNLICKGDIDTVNVLRAHREFKVVPIYVHTRDDIILQRILNRTRRYSEHDYKGMCHKFLIDSKMYTTDALIDNDILYSVDNSFSTEQAIKTLMKIISKETGSKFVMAEQLCLNLD